MPCKIKPGKQTLLHTHLLTQLLLLIAPHWPSALTSSVSLCTSKLSSSTHARTHAHTYRCTHIDTHLLSPCCVWLPAWLAGSPELAGRWAITHWGLFNCVTFHPKSHSSLLSPQSTLVVNCNTMEEHLNCVFTCGKGKKRRLGEPRLQTRPEETIIHSQSTKPENIYIFLNVADIGRGYYQKNVKTWITFQISFLK